MTNKDYYIDLIDNLEAVRDQLKQIDAVAFGGSVLISDKDSPTYQVLQAIIKLADLTKIEAAIKEIN